MTIDERELTARLSRVLDDEATARPDAVAERLRRARRAALAGPPPRAAWSGLRFVPAAVCATAIAGFVLFAELPQGPAQPPALFEDELLSAAAAAPELIADLEFYEWLEADGFHGG
ncbi:MAG: DUF3619 family protein [Gammaproteobacteria bacterium]|nr:DUF3619 family protein [Gammaproteobacteria bacterium]MBI5617891.1 DUF3619 family protein [Gammaproteobacteria bacterium]